MKRIIVRSLFLFSWFFLMGTMALQAQVQQDKEWVVLGSRMANYGVDHDVIKSVTLSERFSSLKIEVTQGDLIMDYVKVHFVDGGEQHLKIRHIFKEGSRTRNFDLKGGPQFIEKIELGYNTKDLLENKTVVTVYGLKTFSKETPMN